MGKLGYVLFGQSSRTMAGRMKGQFGRMAVDILRENPEMKDLDVVYAILRLFEAEPLSVGEPRTTSLSWDTERVAMRNRPDQDMYLHETVIPYRGSSFLWRLVSDTAHAFHTRVIYSEKTARLRMFLPDRDTEQFRAFVRDDLDWIDHLATGQTGAIHSLTSYLTLAADYFYGMAPIGEMRDLARDLGPLSRGAARFET